MVKNPPANAGDSGSILLCNFCVCVHVHVCIHMLLIVGREDSLEKEMATHSSIAWEIPWTEEPGRLQSMGSQRVGHD